MAKLMPCFDGKYKMVATYPEAFICSIDMPKSTLSYTTFHASELCPYKENDLTLFLSIELACPGLVITADGEEEQAVDKIINECKQ